MKVASLFALALGTAASLGAQSAPTLATVLSAAEFTHLEAVRKAVWVDWFSGDVAALRRVLPPELVAMSPGGTHWQSLKESLAGSEKFVADGGKLVSVAFDSTMTHRFGEVVVMFSHYRVVTVRGETRTEQRGRATEVFVHTSGRWVHTSWHLDLAT